MLSWRSWQRVGLIIPRSPVRSRSKAHVLLPDSPGGYDTRLSPERPGFDSRSGNFFFAVLKKGSNPGCWKQTSQNKFESQNFQRQVWQSFQNNVHNCEQKKVTLTFEVKKKLPMARFAKVLEVSYTVEANFPRTWRTESLFPRKKIVSWSQK